MNAPPQPSYWAVLGLTESSINFCEVDFESSSYVAEPFNTISSLPLLLTGLALVALTISEGYAKRFVVSAILLSITGAGSFLFHSTLLAVAQSIDELAMICCAVSFFVSMVLAERPVVRLAGRRGAAVIASWRRQQFLVSLAAIAYCAAFVVAYVSMRSFYPYFACSFGVLVAVTFVRLYQLVRAVPQAGGGATLRRVFWAAVCTSVASFALLWVPDVLFCEQVRPLHLHAIWHVAGCIPPIWMLACIVAELYATRLRNTLGQAVELSSGRILSVEETSLLPGPRGAPLAPLAPLTPLVPLAPITPLSAVCDAVADEDDPEDENEGVTDCGSDGDGDNAVVVVPRVEWVGAGPVRCPVVRLMRRRARTLT